MGIGAPVRVQHILNIGHQKQEELVFLEDIPQCHLAFFDDSRGHLMSSGISAVEKVVGLLKLINELVVKRV